MNNNKRKRTQTALDQASNKARLTVDDNMVVDTNTSVAKDTTNNDTKKMNWLCDVCKVAKESPRLSLCCFI